MEVDSKEICRIIKLCADVGVSRFKFGPVEVDFFETPAQETRRMQKVPERAVEQAQVEKEEIERRELRIKEDEIENLILQDPETYEKLVAQGELVDEKSFDRRSQPDLQ